MFAYPGSKVSGGIARVEDDAKCEAMMQAVGGSSGKGAGGMLTYFYVESIEEALAVRNFPRVRMNMRGEERLVADIGVWFVGIRKSRKRVERF